MIQAWSEAKGDARGGTCQSPLTKKSHTTQTAEPHPTPPQPRPLAVLVLEFLTLLFVVCVVFAVYGVFGMKRIIGGDPFSDATASAELPRVRLYTHPRLGVGKPA